MQLHSLLVLALAVTGLALAQEQEPQQPDIVVILADDMGFSDIGCYGGEIATPNLDRLAAGGLRFTQFYNTGRCCPTRASLLTGLYSHQAGVGWMMSDRGIPGYRGDLSREAVTIAEALQAGGYGTYMSGKWHVTPFVPTGGSKDNWPRARGFDRFFGTIHGAGSFYDPNSLCLDDKRIVPGEDFYYTNAIADHAITFIDEHVQERKEAPLFLYTAFTAPHWPMHALPEDIERYAGRYTKGWDALRAERHARMIELGIVQKDWDLTERDKGVPAWEDADQRDWHVARMQVYAAMIDSMDQNIGRILDRLEAHGRLDNTLVLFLADNGGCAEEYGSRGPERPDPSKPVVRKPMQAGELQDSMIPNYTRSGQPVRTGEGVIPGPEDTYISYGKGWANASNTPFRRYKHWVHEGGISTPLIVHWPAGLRRQGELEEQPGHLIDIMATCIDASGVEYPKQYAGNIIQPMEGLSLLPTFGGKQLKREALYWEHEGNRAVRVADWKLVAAGKNGPWELFDLSKDRTELNDLAAAQPKQAAQLAARWQSWAERANVLPLNPPGRPREFSKERSFRLKSGASLPAGRAPNVVESAFRVVAKLEGRSGDGVVVAQGGSSHGWALYLKDDLAHFTVRRNGVLKTLRTAQPIRITDFILSAELHADGELQLEVGGTGVPTQQASGAGPGLLSEMPGEGLEVGRDEGGAVGDYATPFALEAKLEIKIDLVKD